MNVGTTLHSSTMSTESLFLSNDDNSDIEFAYTTTYVPEKDTHDLTNRPVVSIGSFSETFLGNFESEISDKKTNKSNIINIDNNNNDSNLTTNSITDTDIDSSIINLTNKVKNNFLLATQELDKMLRSSTQRKSIKSAKNDEDENITKIKMDPSATETLDHTNIQESASKSVVNTPSNRTFHPRTYSNTPK